MTLSPETRDHYCPACHATRAQWHRDLSHGVENPWVCIRSDNLVRLRQAVEFLAKCRAIVGALRQAGTLHKHSDRLGQCLDATDAVIVEMEGLSAT